MSPLNNGIHINLIFTGFASGYSTSYCSQQNQTSRDDQRSIWMWTETLWGKLCKLMLRMTKSFKNQIFFSHLDFWTKEEIDFLIVYLYIPILCYVKLPWISVSTFIKFHHVNTTVVQGSIIVYRRNLLGVYTAQRGGSLCSGVNISKPNLQCLLKGLVTLPLWFKDVFSAILTSLILSSFH